MGACRRRLSHSEALRTRSVNVRRGNVRATVASRTSRPPKTLCSCDPTTTKRRNFGDGMNKYSALLSLGVAAFGITGLVPSWLSLRSPLRHRQRHRRLPLPPPPSPLRLRPPNRLPFRLPQRRKPPPQPRSKPKRLRFRRPRLSKRPRPRKRNTPSPPASVSASARASRICVTSRTRWIRSRSTRSTPSSASAAA